MGGRAFALIAAVLVLTGLLVRCWTASRNPIPDGDGVAAYILLADNLNRGLGFQTFVKWTLYDDSMELLRPEGNRQPLMPMFLAVVFLATGLGMTQAQAGVLFIGLAAMAVCTAWAARLFGRHVALLVLAFIALDPPFIWYSVQPHSHMLYLTLFYLTLLLADGERMSWGRAALLGGMSGLTYLARTQGLLLIPAIGLWILLRGGERKWLKAAVGISAALMVISPWLVRNYRTFGNPTYSQNVQFLLGENHWSVNSIRDAAPSPTDMLEHQGPAAVATYLAAGALRVAEPFTTGGQQGETYAQPTLAPFVLLGLLALLRSDVRRRMLLPFLAVIPVLLALVLHEHPGRYMMIAVPATVALGGRGLELLASDSGRRKLVPWILLVSGLPLLRPVLVLLRSDTRERAAEAMEAALWIRDNASDSSWVCTYPNVDLLDWVYRKPTLTWPNDYEMLLWPYLEAHGVQYMVVDRDLPGMRPWLSNCWRRSPDGGSWAATDAPPFLSEAWRSASGNTIIYEFTGPVPEGYMAVDPLPPDYLRALPPVRDR
jgi:4-amino-4-deoxy-L-arabinose transferase-like glycosyltransferase